MDKETLVNFPHIIFISCGERGNDRVWCVSEMRSSRCKAQQTDPFLNSCVSAEQRAYRVCLSNTEINREGGGWKIGARWPPGCPQMSDNLGFRAWSGKFWSLQWKHRWDLKALWTQRQKGPRANMHIHRHIVCFRETWMRKTGGYKSPKPDWTGRPLCEVHCNVSRAISWTLEL